MPEDRNPSPPTPPPAAAPPSRRAWDGRWQRWLFGLILSAIVIVAGALLRGVLAHDLVHMSVDE